MLRGGCTGHVQIYTPGPPAPPCRSQHSPQGSGSPDSEAASVEQAQHPLMGLSSSPDLAKLGEKRHHL